MTVSVTAQVDRTKMPKKGPAPKIQLGKPQSFTLKNGLKVIVVENHKLPRASATLTIDNPPSYEGDKAGVSSLLSAMLGTGTTSKSKDEFNKRVDYLGARVRFSSSGAGASALSKYFDEVLSLMIDGALHPVFKQEEFDAEKNKFIEGIKSEENSVKSTASKVRSALTYGKNHPWGEIVTLKTAGNVTLEDVKAFYHKRFNPNNAYLVVVGDVDFKDIKKKLTKELGGWKKAPDTKYVFPKVENVATTEIDFIDMPNAVQSEIAIISTHDLKKTDKDYHKVLIANNILGGDFNSYLNMNLREAHGWTYGARSSTSANRYKGKFLASTSVRNAVTDSAVVEAMKEIKRIKNELVSDKKLKISKAKYVGNFVMALERPSTIARYALNKEIDNLPDDFYETYLEKIEKVTAEDVKEIANKYFKDENARIIVVGKAVDVLPGLEKLPYKINYFDKEGNPTSKPELNKKVSKDITPKSVIEKYINAIGGMDAIKKVNTIKVVADGEIQGQQLELTTTQKNPNKYAMKMVLKAMGMEITAVKFNGEKGSIAQQGQSQAMPEAMVNEFKSRTTIFEEVDLLNNLKNVSLEAIEKVNGEDAYKLVVDKEGKKTIRYYNVNSGLFVKQVEKKGNMEQATEMGDYKVVKDVKFPYSIKSNMGPTSIEFKVTTILVNEGVTDADFE